MSSTISQLRQLLPPIMHGGILSDSELNKIALQNNGEPLSPWFSQQRRENSLPSFGLGAATYDIRLGYEFRSFIDFATEQGEQANLNNPIDLTNPDSLLTDHIMLHTNEYFDLAPGAFILAKAIEYFRMPRDIIGIVSDKSTWARCGLAVQNTVIDAGFIGDLTLELSNHNFRPIRLYPGCGIAQIHFHRVIGEITTTYAERHDNKGGKYQHQSGVVGPL
jgi:dCTP deaminase